MTTIIIILKIYAALVLINAGILYHSSRIIIKTKEDYAREGDEIINQIFNPKIKQHE